MTEAIQQHSLKCINGTHSASTDYDWILADAENTQTLIKGAVIVNNNDTGSASQTVTLKVQKYSGGAYGVILTKTYTVADGETEIPVELGDIVLLGDASNPDKVTIRFSASLGAADTLDCLASSIKFS